MNPIFIGVIGLGILALVMGGKKSAPAQPTVPRREPRRDEPRREEPKRDDPIRQGETVYEVAEWVPQDDFWKALAWNFRKKTGRTVGFILSRQANGRNMMGTTVAPATVADYFRLYGPPDGYWPGTGGSWFAADGQWEWSKAPQGFPPMVKMQRAEATQKPVYL